MRTSETIKLPIADQEYNLPNEQTMRRTVEQSFQDLRGDMIEVRDGLSKPASLALRRHQFLLMGA